MNSYDQRRIEELIGLDEAFEPSDAKSIVDWENDMTTKKDMVVELNRQGIIGNDELEEKLANCFNEFLKKIVLKYGVDICRKVYDYVPDETFAFLRPLLNNDVRNEALRIEVESSRLMELLLTDEGKGPNSFAVLHSIEAVHESSIKLLRNFDQDREALLSILKGIESNIETLNVLIMPTLLHEPTDAIEPRSDIKEHMESLNV